MECAMNNGSRMKFGWLCVNDTYDAEYSTKNDERDKRVQDKAYVPNTYMNLADPSSYQIVQASNKARLQTMICSYLPNLA